MQTNASLAWHADSPAGNAYQEAFDGLQADYAAQRIAALQSEKVIALILYVLVQEWLSAHHVETQFISVFCFGCLSRSSLKFVKLATGLLCGGS